jgi:hypothetical protein
MTFPAGRRARGFGFTMARPAQMMSGAKPSHT